MSKEANGREREERLQIMQNDEEFTALDLADIDLKKAGNNRKSEDFGVMESKRT